MNVGINPQQKKSLMSPVDIQIFLLSNHIPIVAYTLKYHLHYQYFEIIGILDLPLSLVT